MTKPARKPRASAASTARKTRSSRAASPPASARVELRTEPVHKELLERASALSGQPVSAFIMSAALSRARDVVREHEALVFSDRARDALLELLDAPPVMPDAALVAALRAHADAVRRP
jgi:uncharacterized protein (DUF1778 family)